MDGVELEVPARPEYVGLVRLIVSSFASAVHELDDELLDNLKLAVSEACTLVVEAGDGPDRRMMLRCEDEPDAFIVHVSDGGGRVVPEGAEAREGLPDPHLLDEDDTVPFQLMRTLVDDVTVVRQGGGEALRLRLACPPAHPYEDADPTAP